MQLSAGRVFINTVMTMNRIGILCWHLVLQWPRPVESYLQSMVKLTPLHSLTALSFHSNTSSS